MIVFICNLGSKYHSKLNLPKPLPPLKESPLKFLPKLPSFIQLYSPFSILSALQGYNNITFSIFISKTILNLDCHYGPTCLRGSNYLWTFPFRHYLSSYTHTSKPFISVSPVRVPPDLSPSIQLNIKKYTLIFCFLVLF